MSAVVDVTFDDVTYKQSEATEVNVGNVVVSFGDSWVVSGGEYTYCGEPDLLVSVDLAIDEDGNDIRQQVAQIIARALSGGDQ